ncbi:MAG TPA: hypothetical protein VGM88_11345 [Kofleriaceae bacterium]|jgi:hypothetical protein
MTLVAARIELHYAAQILAACADAWLPRRADDGHTAMRWLTPALVGETGLALHCVTLELRAADGATFALAGRTLADALAWADPKRGARLRDYDLPESPLRTGGAFAAPTPELAELARWYDAGLAAVSRVAGAASIRVWPHHFDLGAVLDDGIGVGLSPGDRYYAEPYYYVIPARPVATAPAIGGGGFWRTDGWQGAVLLGGAPDAFLASSIAALR